ncbi:MerR family transcriptional regulator [Brevundimonas sp.]|uniref:MerR family transcriptional regulator n=1 Tax=Brevundimonas sp. TaxID=1871086 RepID=UPI002CD31CE8|nr:MerR family DNA-binding protein [Brevundimonas sp.]HWQ87032.1 MerR family DNA-binding protein [Brevundimonas sp.]
MTTTDAAMTIGRLAKAGGVGVETVRYYQRRGLMETPAREGSGVDGGVRRYDRGDLRRLRFIRAAQAAGFTLEQIGELLELDSGTDRTRARRLAEDRIAALDARIAELETARAALQRLARDCRTGGVGPCPIIAAFETAGRPN